MSNNISIIMQLILVLIVMVTKFDDGSTHDLNTEYIVITYEYHMSVYKM
jgi:hypothetical protein